LTSTALDGLRLRAEGTLLRVYDPLGELLPTARELDGIAYERELEQSEMERLLRDREARLVELEAQLAHLQKQSED